MAIPPPYPRRSGEFERHAVRVQQRAVRRRQAAMYYWVPP